MTRHLTAHGERKVATKKKTGVLTNRWSGVGWVVKKDEKIEPCAKGGGRQQGVWKRKKERGRSGSRIEVRKRSPLPQHTEE
jgi:hypothetical protein